VFEGDGRVVRYPGNYEMARTLRNLAQEQDRATAPEEPASSARRTQAAPAAPRPRRPGKLTFKEQRELEGMEDAILAAEGRKRALEAALSDPSTYQTGGAGVAALRADLEQVTAEVERLYARWQELEGMAAPG
jgi:ATP-binding cassette subfamily F protein uup